MQQPAHAIRATSAHQPRRDFTIVAVVGLLHVTAIAALYLGLLPMIAPSFTPPITLTPVKLQPVSKVELTPPSAVKPIDVQPRIEIPPVDFVIKDTITVPNQPVVPPHQGGTADTHPVTPAALPPSAPVGIAATHTTPDYPPMSRRLNEEGAVRLRLAIAPEGNVNDASVEHSSGFSRLDDAAVAWVRTHWRYRPATREGKPIPSSVEAVVTFQLRKG